MTKAINGYTRVVLEALEHKITPYVKRIKGLIERVEFNAFCKDTAKAIKKEADKLEEAVTQLVLKEMEKVRDGERRSGND